MNLFKTFLKILNKYKGSILLFTILLIVFAGLNMTSSENALNFEATKPDIWLINKDPDNKFTLNLVNYLKENNNIISTEENKEQMADALFYRDVNLIIMIPENFGKDFMALKNPTIEIKSTKDYNATLANINLEKYLKIATVYRELCNTEDEVIASINNTLKENTTVEVHSTLDTTKLERVTFYYNFMNYSILAGCIYVICLILASFKNEKIKKRTVISSTNYKKYNRILLLSNGLFALLLWGLYILLGIFLLGNIMFTTHGIMYILNSLLFTWCALTLAFLLGNLITNKNALNGIINVIALGTSFLCGAFVPMEWLPDSVLKIAHILPSYWYIKTNEIIKTTENFTNITLKPIFTNMLMVLAFSILFIILTNRISKKKQKITS